ncbi:MAG: RluA family pseudouridine synthase [Treponema sp.]|nr:RluA family pseudouridine synthase [Treponema sp.]
MIELKAGPDDAGRRLDRILRKALPDHSLSLIHRLLRQGKIKVNGKSAKPDERVQTGAKIHIRSMVNHNYYAVNENKTVSPGPLPAILWQGSGIIVFNKPPGLASHGPNSLDNLVKAHFAGRQPTLTATERSLSFKPGPLHRLDKPTSGAIAFSETLEGAQLFSRLLRERKLIKTYLAIVEGSITGEILWQDELIRDTDRKKTLVETGLNAQNAITAIRSLAGNGAYTLVEAGIMTGRTHQIRAQAAAHGHPLAGDIKYGGHAVPDSRKGVFFLHAWKLELDTQAETIAAFPCPLVAPPPESFLAQIQKFFPGFSHPLFLICR